MQVDRTLMGAAVAHAVAAMFSCPLIFLRFRGDLPEHPAAKPLRFALSIALFLGSLSFVVPLLALDRSWKELAAKLLVATMSAEMVLITMQALRGRASHFNVATPADAIVWRVMVGAIVLATVVILYVAWVASMRPLRDAEGVAIDPLIATGWRSGLWSFLIAAYTGFRMGGARRHTVGGADTGPRTAVLGWSTEHGDLRVAHFFALHALQVLPLFAALLTRAPLPEGVRWALLLLAIGGQSAVTIGTLLQAHQGRPAF